MPTRCRKLQPALLARLSVDQVAALWVVRGATRKSNVPLAVQRAAAQVQRAFAAAGQGDGLSWLVKVCRGEIAATTEVEIATLRRALDQIAAVVQQGR
jgi:hypothetical protein